MNPNLNKILLLAAGLLGFSTAIAADPATLLTTCYLTEADYTYITSANNVFEQRSNISVLESVKTLTYIPISFFSIVLAVFIYIVGLDFKRYYKQDWAVFIGLLTLGIGSIYFSYSLDTEINLRAKEIAMTEKLNAKPQPSSNIYSVCSDEYNSNQRIINLKVTTDINKSYFETEKLR